MFKWSPRLPKICYKCKNPFLGKQHNSKFCDDCKKLLPCKCGCRKLVNPLKSGYATGCKNRGKTYKEIYGSKEIKCGFKKGLENPNYTSIQFQRFKLRLLNSIGEKY